MLANFSLAAEGEPESYQKDQFQRYLISSALIVRHDLPDVYHHYPKWKLHSIQHNIKRL